MHCTEILRILVVVGSGGLLWNIITVKKKFPVRMCIVTTLINELRHKLFVVYFISGEITRN